MSPEEAEDFYEEDEPAESIFAAWRRGQLCLICAQRPIGWALPYWFTRWHITRVKESRDFRISDVVNVIDWVFWMIRHPDGKGP